MVDIQTMKARVDLRPLVQETHPVVKGSKTYCLWHDDRNPSLHIYPDGYFCFACGASGDHLDWLIATRALSFQEAVDLLAPHIGASSHALPPITSSKPLKDEVLEKPTFEWHLPLRQHQLETHKRRAANLSKVPEALAGRGFTLTDCKQLDIINENGNAIFPVTGPSWVLTLKCRYANPNPNRYEYITPGRGTPAWCSPGINKAETVFVVEGELNGMVCWLACQEKQIGVMGTAGTNGQLHLDILKNRTIYVYADDDEAGHEAKQRWATQALGAGAGEVFVLEPWSMDACDIAGAFGKAGLRKRLTWSKKRRFTLDEAIGAVDLSSATPPALKPFPVSSRKPNLVQWCSHSEGIGSHDPRRYLQNRSPALTLESCHDAA